MKLKLKTIQTKLFKALKKTSHQKVPRLAQKVRNQRMSFYNMLLHEGLQFKALHTRPIILRPR
jgi:hypothetical protein